MPHSLLLGHQSKRVKPPSGSSDVIPQAATALSRGIQENHGQALSNGFYISLLSLLGGHLKGKYICGGITAVSTFEPYFNRRSTADRYISLGGQSPRLCNAPRLLNVYGLVVGTRDNRRRQHSKGVRSRLANKGK